MLLLDSFLIMSGLDQNSLILTFVLKIHNILNTYILPELSWTSFSFTVFLCLSLRPIECYNFLSLLSSMGGGVSFFSFLFSNLSIFDLKISFWRKSLTSFILFVVFSLSYPYFYTLSFLPFSQGSFPTPLSLRFYSYFRVKST